MTQPMRHEFDFGPDLPFKIIRTYGLSSVAGFERYLNEMVNHPQFVPAGRYMVDHRQLDFTNLHTMQIKAIADEVAKLSPRLGPCRVAIVTEGEVMYGLARMWEIMTEDRMLAQCCIFMDYDEGVAWLSAESAASGDAEPAA